MKEFKPVPELDWCGQRIAPGGSYGGKPEHIKKQHPKNVITEKDMAEVFANGACTRTKAEAAKLLEDLTGGHRTSCYRSLRLDGRFGRHLYPAGTKLGWR